MEIERAYSFFKQKGDKSYDQIIETIVLYFDITKEEVKKMINQKEK